VGCGRAPLGQSLDFEQFGGSESFGLDHVQHEGAQRAAAVIVDQFAESRTEGILAASRGKVEIRLANLAARDMSFAQQDCSAGFLIFQGKRR
jgi:hypothetical protein